MNAADNPHRTPGIHFESKSRVAISALLLLLMLTSPFTLLNQTSAASASSPQVAKPVVDKAPVTFSQISGHSYQTKSPLTSTRVRAPPSDVNQLNGTSHPSFFRLPKRNSAEVGLQGTVTQPPYFHGGPVMKAPVVYLVFWRPTGYNFDTSDSSYFGLISRYFTDVSGSNFYNILAQYYGSNGQPSNRVVFGGSYIYPASFPNKEGSSSNPLLDSDIQSLVLNFNQYYSLSGGVDEEVFVFTPLNVYQCYDPSHTQCAYTQYGGYHSNFTNSGHELVYSYLPDLGTDCVHWCPPYPSPNNDQFADLMIDVVAHEQFESASDPITGTGWLASNVQTEIGDLCAGIYGTVDNVGSNIALNGDKYLIQQMWSNYDGGCSQAFSPTFAHISLNPSTSSTPLSMSNLFRLRFPIGTDTLTVSYVGSPVNVTINPFSTLTITGNSTGSSSGESWCLEASCHDISIQTSIGQLTLNRYYFDILPIQIELNTFDTNAPSITLHYSAAPDSPSSVGALNLTSLTLSALSSLIWTQRGSIVNSSISAAESGGWKFESWTGTGAASYSGSDQFSTRVNSAMTEKATFYPGITVTASNDGSVSYTYGSTTGIVAAGTSQTIYVPQGIQVTFTANPSSILFLFTHWTGVSTTNKTQTSATINSPSTLSAAFGYNYPLILGAVGSIAAIGGASALLWRRRGKPSASFPAPAPVPVAGPIQPPTKLCVSCNSIIPFADARCPVCGFSQTRAK